MKVVFRVDASLQIGTGHVMRCLTLADALAAQGADCQFICREHKGNLIKQIRNKGYVAHALPVLAPAGTNEQAAQDMQQTHDHWLGTTQDQDAQACAAILADLRPDWLIVDHYALDARWELALKPHYRKLMVIDDLADRPHQCDLLLDQTHGRDQADYGALVPAGCQLLCGSQYALLRPEFASLREYSLQRRAEPQLRHLLITMGGVDKSNATGQVLKALRDCPLPEECRITVVMGATAPWLAEVRSQAQGMPWSTRVLVEVSDMARLMADSDLAIGAAGATAWERCCLGLPTIICVLADNQRTIAQALFSAGAAQPVDLANLDQLQFVINQFLEMHTLSSVSTSAGNVTDGTGLSYVFDVINRQG